MEKAILKTLAYADIFDYPLKVWEIHKWIIQKSLTLRQVEKVLKAESLKFKVQNYKGLYFLSGRRNIVTKRFAREKQSLKYFEQARFVARILCILPGIKLIGVSGNLAMMNAEKKDDVDLFIITAKKRLWITRLVVLGILGALGRRRKRGEGKKTVGGKFCANLFIEEDQIEQINKDIYTAHEVLQMKVLYERDNMYRKFLEANVWVFGFLPNWKARESQKSKFKSQKYRLKLKSFELIGDFLNEIARIWQVKLMGKPDGDERISMKAVYFHPTDYRKLALNAYHTKLSRLSLASAKRALNSSHRLPL